MRCARTRWAAIQPQQGKGETLTQHRGGSARAPCIVLSKRSWSPQGQHCVTCSPEIPSQVCRDRERDGGAGAWGGGLGEGWWGS